MRVFFFLILALGSFPSRAEVPVDRAQANESARRQFLSLNFFSNGRGMHLSPGLIDYYNKAMDALPSPGNRELDLRTYFTRRWGLQVEGR